MTFGDKLKLLRKEAGLTQLQLAKKIKLSASTVGMYEQNRRDPDTQTVVLLADLFGITADELLGSSIIYLSPTPDADVIVQDADSDSTRKVNIKIDKKNKPISRTLTKDEFLKQADIMFMDVSEEDRDMLYKTLTDIYFDSKAKNKVKYNPNKNREK